MQVSRVALAFAAALLAVCLAADVAYAWPFFRPRNVFEACRVELLQQCPNGDTRLYCLISNAAQVSDSVCRQWLAAEAPCINDAYAVSCPVRSTEAAVMCLLTTSPSTVSDECKANAFYKLMASKYVPRPPRDVFEACRFEFLQECRDGDTRLYCLISNAAQVGEPVCQQWLAAEAPCINDAYAVGCPVKKSEDAVKCLVRARPSAISDECKATNVYKLLAPKYTPRPPRDVFEACRYELEQQCRKSDTRLYCLISNVAQVNEPVCQQWLAAEAPCINDAYAAGCSVKKSEDAVKCLLKSRTAAISDECKATTVYQLLAPKYSKKK